MWVLEILGAENLRYPPKEHASEMQSHEYIVQKLSLNKLLFAKHVVISEKGSIETNFKNWYTKILLLIQLLTPIWQDDFKDKLFLEFERTMYPYTTHAWMSLLLRWLRVK